MDKNKQTKKNTKVMTKKGECTLFPPYTKEIRKNLQKQTNKQTNNTQYKQFHIPYIRQNRKQ